MSRSEIETKTIGTNSIAPTMAKDSERTYRVFLEISKFITKILQVQKYERFFRIVCYHGEFRRFAGIDRLVI